MRLCAYPVPRIGYSMKIDQTVVQFRLELAQLLHESEIIEIYPPE